MTRLMITLTPDERAALQAYAARELRDPRAQVVLLLRSELERLGFLRPIQKSDPPPLWKPRKDLLQ